MGYEKNYLKLLWNLRKVNLQGTFLNTFHCLFVVFVGGVGWGGGHFLLFLQSFFKGTDYNDLTCAFYTGAYLLLFIA